MKIVIKIFLWVSMILNGITSIGILLLFWGPLYLAVTRGEQYYWTGLIEVFLTAIIGFIISLIFYKHIIKYKPTISKKNSIIFLILIMAQIIIFPIIFRYLSIILYPQLKEGLSFDIILRWTNIFPLGYLLILITYPKLIKKYFLKK
jgi:hypothetical protein